MKTIKILGTGCPNCKRTEAVIKTVVDELGLKDVQIEKVEDIEDIMAYDIMSTPAVVIDDKVVVKGRVPSFDEVKQLLKEDDACCNSDDSSCCDETENATSSCCGSDSDTSSSCC
ncbi:MAG TPA: thioredoxin family protein [Flavobacteriia bacterium]|nr:thioredoxin family protein [Flavobacteriia bacterium]